VNLLDNGEAAIAFWRKNTGESKQTPRQQKVILALAESRDRTALRVLSALGLALSEKQIPRFIRRVNG
jgi:hypothetical protein